jgi:hypothetical protein
MNKYHRLETYEIMEIIIHYMQDKIEDSVREEETDNVGTSEEDIQNRNLRYEAEQHTAKIS